MSMPQVKHFSADDVRALPDDGNRYETVHGELLVTPAPGRPHQLVLARLFVVLNQYLTANGLEQLYWSPAEISFDEDTLLQPDLFVADYGPVNRGGKWSDLRTLFLVVEAVSPSSGKADRITKRRRYQEARIPEYWVVDSVQRQVEVWTTDAQLPVVHREQLMWRHPLLTDSCAVDLVTLFS